MKKKLQKKLKLNRETLHHLNSQEVRRAAGAGLTDLTCGAQTCPPTFGDNTCLNCPESGNFLC